MYRSKFEKLNWMKIKRNIKRYLCVFQFCYIVLIKYFVFIQIGKLKLFLVRDFLDEIIICRNLKISFWREGKGEKFSLKVD